MPVTARLSKRFYDRLGEDVANELVDWFNAVDTSYHNDLRELNELNFARFDAKQAQRLAELRGELLARIEQRLGEQTRWFFLAWAAQFAAIIGVWAAVVSLRT